MKVKEEKESNKEERKDGSEEKVEQYYYEEGDMVFAKTEKEIFQPAIVVKTLYNYKRYRIRFIDEEEAAKKSEIFDNLKDYNAENLDTFRKIADESSPQEA